MAIFHLETDFSYEKRDLFQVELCATYIRTHKHTQRYKGRLLCGKASGQVGNASIVRKTLSLPGHSECISPFVLHKLHTFRGKIPREKSPGKKSITRYPKIACVGITVSVCACVCATFEIRCSCFVSFRRFRFCFLSHAHARERYGIKLRNFAERIFWSFIFVWFLVHLQIKRRSIYARETKRLQTSSLAIAIDEIHSLRKRFPL